MITPADRNPPLSQLALRRLTDVVNLMLTGKMNNTGTLTLTAGSPTTVVEDFRVGVDSKVFLTPRTASAAATTGLYISSLGKQTFTITHNNNAATDRTFDYAILG